MSTYIADTAIMLSEPGIEEAIVVDYVRAGIGAAGFAFYLLCRHAVIKNIIILRSKLKIALTIILYIIIIFSYIQFARIIHDHYS